tara:strand:- start:642 stop:836 length:195 start_codon:yes stop_codon:yes gene_type:complete
MKLSEKSKQLAYVVWINLFIGFYNIYLFGQDSQAFNLIIGIFNVGVWVFLRNNELRLEYLKKKS